MWSNIRDNTKAVDGESVGYYDLKKKKPLVWWKLFEHSRTKETGQTGIFCRIQLNRDNYQNERWEISHTLRNKKRDFSSSSFSSFLLPFQRKSYSGFLHSEKIHRPQPGLNLRTPDPVASMITTGPPCRPILSEYCMLVHTG